MTDWTRDDWARVDALFRAALELPEADRDAFLRASGEPERIVERVAGLLASQDVAEMRIGESVRPLAEEIDVGGELAGRRGGEPDAGDDLEDFPPGTEIGPYRVVEEIGRGGMGTVYLAERSDDKFDRRVALKVVKRGMDTDEIVARFRREGRMLARLEHPRISRMYDADVAPDGRPYLVLQYVDGRPIDVHCDAERIDVEGRIRLFLEVCDAVAFAHTKLVLHRDLKPSNILVSKDGPMLLDFGVGKLLDDSSGDTQDLTSAVGRRLTPEYASPEQLAGREVSTASDVYSLGVVLHELLTGVRPTAGVTRAPSAIVTGDDADLGTAAASRRSTRKGLARRLHGDLDVILLKALHDDTTRRYASVEALAADLRRHLEGLPVRARPDSVPYRVRKFVRRNPLPVLSGSGLGISVVLFAIGSLLQANETARALDRAEQERARAEAVSAVLQDMFAGAGFESGERIDTMTVRAFLDRSAADVIEELGDQPAVQGTLLRVLGQAQHALGRLPTADSLLTRAVVVLESAEPSDPRELLFATRELGHVKNRQGKWTEAIDLYQGWLSSEVDLEPRDLAEVSHNVAVARLQMGDLEQAISLEDSVIAIHRARPEMDPEGFGAALTMRAGMARQQGDTEAALAFAREALERVESALGVGHPRLFLYEQNYALLLYRSEGAEEAEPVFADLVRRYSEQVGESVEFAALLSNYGNVLRDVGRSDEALAYGEEALTLQRRIFGAVHPAHINTLDGLGATLEALGRDGRAAEIYREQQEIAEVVFGSDHPESAIARYKAAGARCAASAGAFDEFAQDFDGASQVLSAALPPAHPALADLERRRSECRQRRP